ncbi:MAG: nitrous oxide reductase accessory protein NosL [Acidimicrobiia bacterium]
MQFRLLNVLVMGGLVLAACDSGQVGGLPEINYGRDICIECGMIVDDPRFAAAYRLDDGIEKIFDDLGGLILDGRESGDLSDAHVWVSDFDNQVLIEANSAYFVPTLGVVSPMGHGILAYSDRSRAEATATDLDGEVIRWDTVVDLPVIDGLVGGHHDEHGEHDG